MYLFKVNSTCVSAIAEMPGNSKTTKINIIHLMFDKKASVKMVYLVEIICILILVICILLF